MSFNESIRAHFIVARGHKVTKKNSRTRNGGGFEGLNLQFRTTFLNVEHFYDDQFRKEGGAKKTTKETKRRVKSSWESHFPRSFKFFGPDLVFRHLINITKNKYSNVMALKK